MSVCVCMSVCLCVSVCVCVRACVCVCVHCFRRSLLDVFCIVLEMSSNTLMTFSIFVVSPVVSHSRIFLSFFLSFFPPFFVFAMIFCEVLFVCFQVNE